MGFASLVGVQMISHAAEGNKNPLEGMVHIFSKGILEEVTAHAAETDVVNIPEANLKSKVKKALNVTDETEITEEKTFKVEGLDIGSSNITDFTGLEYACNLKKLITWGNDLN